MSLRNRLYRLQYRSVKNFNKSNFIEQSQQKQYEKQLHSIETILHIMYSAFKNNLKMQEIYLDLVKARGRNVRIRGKDIKKVYQLLSQNKTAEITFDKVYQTQQRQRKLREQAISNIWTQRQGNNTKTKDIMIATVNKIFQKQNTEQSQISSRSQKKVLNTKKQPYQLNQQQRRQQNSYMKILTSHYKRLYSRLIEEITKKLTYYIINKNKLYEFLIYSIAQVTKRLQTILRRVNDMKDTKAILDVIKLVFDENLVLEQKIYQALVDYGHVVSIQEFFRISGRMMEDSQAIQNKNSRMSEVSKQLSVISSRSSQNQYQQNQPRNIKKFPQHKKGLKNYNNKKTNQKIGFIQKTYDQQKSQKPERQQKNIVHIEKIHKQIQTKYGTALDQISDLIINHQQKIQKQNPKILLQEDEIVTKDDENLLEENKEKSSQNTINSFDRWKRQNEKRKTTAKKTISAFQYFSPQFKKVINELDEKKGKHPLRVHNTTDTTSNFYQNTQLGKITNETISFKNPLNVARLLGKRFKTIANTQVISINKSRHIRNMARQKTEIYNLLKMYQSNQKQNQNLDQLLKHKSNTINVQQLKFQMDLVKQKIIKQIKRKKSMFVKRNNSLTHNKKSDEQLIKQIEDQYERLVRQKKLKGVKFNDDDLRVDFNVSEDGFEEIDMNCINENLKSDKKIHLKTKIQHQPHSPKLKPNSKLMIEPIKLSYLEKVYNQFTNPLNLKQGFYNDEKYRSLRSSLQKRQINTLKLKKCRYIKQDTFVIKKNVAFGQKKSQNSLQHKKSKKTFQNCKNLNQRPQRRSHPNLFGNKSPLNQNFNNTFLLTSCQISTPKIQHYPFNSKDLEKYIQWNLKQNNLNTSNSIQECELLHFKQNASLSKINKNQEMKKIQSLRNTPRNSWGRKNQVYSTQRRRKID